MNITRRSCKLAFLLRHDRAYPFDVHGWRAISDLLEHHGFTMEELCKIVESNNKRRFEFSEDMQYVRARQGHSIPVDVELNECVPPSILFHGTAEHFVDDILKDGLKSQNRLHVHLSSTIETALNVGKRHGTPVVIKVDSLKMHKDGAKFYLSRNGVWLTDFVATEYLSID